MLAKTTRALIPLIVGIGLSMVPSSAYANTINFDTIPDQTNVDSFYLAQGVMFNNAISLTAGFSLNEADTLHTVELES
jgi:hypothetical protein